MAWIESHQSLATHRKTKALKRLLRINTVKAVGHLHLLWWWCLDNAPDGSFEGLHPQDISEAAEWTGDPETFLKALVESGFCDRENENSPVKLHDWDEYAGKLIRRRVANRERMKAERATHVQRTNKARAIATVPNSTQQNNTIKENKEIELPDFIKKETWDAFMEVRKKQRALPTPRAAELLIKALEKFKDDGDDPNEILCQSIMNNWKGLFPLKKNNGYKQDPFIQPLTGVREIT